MRQHVSGSNPCAIALERPIVNLKLHLWVFVWLRSSWAFLSLDCMVFSPKHMHTRPILTDDREIGYASFPAKLAPNISAKAKTRSRFPSDQYIYNNWSGVEIWFIHGQWPLYKTGWWHCLARCWLAGNSRLALIDRKQWEEVPQVMQLALCKFHFRDSIQQSLWCLTWKEPNDFIDPLRKSFAQVWWYSQELRKRMHVHKLLPVACNWCT